MEGFYLMKKCSKISKHFPNDSIVFKCVSQYHPISQIQSHCLGMFPPITVISTYV